MKYISHDKEALTSERATVVSSNFSSEEIEVMTKEVSQLYKVRQSLGKDTKKDSDTTRHFVLSLPQGEKLSDEKWAEVGTKFLQGMGYITKDGEALTLFQMVKHSDTDFDHLHIATSRIKFDGKLIDHRNEQHIAHAVTQELEKLFDLQTAKQRPQELGNRFKINLPSIPDEAEFKKEVKAISGFGQQTAKVKMLAETLHNADVASNKFFTSNIQFIKNDEDKILLKFKNNMSVFLTKEKLSDSFTCLIKVNKEFNSFAEEFKTNLAGLVAVQAVATKQPQPQLDAGTQQATDPAPAAQPAQPNPWQALEEPPAPQEPFSLPVDDPAPAAAFEEQWEALAALPASQQVAPDVQAQPLAQTDLFEPFSNPAATPNPEDAFQSLLEAVGGTGRGIPHHQVEPGHGAEAMEAEVEKATQQAKTKNGSATGGGGHHQGISMHMPVDQSKGTPVVVSGIVAGMDGSIAALLKQIAHLLSIIMQGNYFEAVKQRALVQDQIRSLKAQVSMLEQAEANVKNKNVFNKHNFHKNADMAVGKSAKNSNGGTTGSKQNQQTNPFEDRNDLSLQEMAMENLMHRIQALEWMKNFAQTEEQVLDIEGRIAMAMLELKGIVQLMESKAALASTTRRKFAPKPPSWVK